MTVWHLIVRGWAVVATAVVLGAVVVVFCRPARDGLVGWVGIEDIVDVDGPDTGQIGAGT